MHAFRHMTTLLATWHYISMVIQWLVIQLSTYVLYGHKHVQVMCAVW